MSQQQACTRHSHKQEHGYKIRACGGTARWSGVGEGGRVLLPSELNVCCEIALLPAQNSKSDDWLLQAASRSCFSAKLLNFSGCLKGQFTIATLICNKVKNVDFGLKSRFNCCSERWMESQPFPSLSLRVSVQMAGSADPVADSLQPLFLRHGLWRAYTVGHSLSVLSLRNPSAHFLAPTTELRIVKTMKCPLGYNWALIKEGEGRKREQKRLS